MQEIELKFQVPPDRLDALKAALLALPQASATPLAMHAAYLDTPDSRLAARKMALRVRREGAAWVQTFKAGGADAMTRLEDNVALPAQGPVFRDGRPVADLSLHADAAVQAALTGALSGALTGASAAAAAPGEAPAQASLGVVYDTVFERHTADVRGPRGAVQLCLDQGEVRAGNLSEALCEMEFELLDGSPQAVIDTARHWVDTHGLWLDVQSKAYRGTRLAQAARAGDPMPACRPVPFEVLPTSPSSAHAPDADAHHAWLLSTLNTTLDIAAGNLSEVACSRPGWQTAALAWRQALQQIDTLSHASEALRQALPASTWALGEQLIEALDKNPDPALAQSAPATHWALEVLGAISALAAAKP